MVYGETVTYVQEWFVTLNRSFQGYHYRQLHKMDLFAARRGLNSIIRKFRLGRARYNFENQTNNSKQ